MTPAPSGAVVIEMPRTAGGSAAKAAAVPLLQGAAPVAGGKGEPVTDWKTQAIVFTLRALDLLVWLFSFVGPWEWLTASRDSRCGSIAPTSDPDVRRHMASFDALLTTVKPCVQTAHDLLQRAFGLYATCDAHGIREFLGDHKPEGAKFALKMFGETRYVKYSEVGEQVAKFGRGLVELGMKPCPRGEDIEHNQNPSTLLIFEETCPEWLIACFGAFSQSLSVATSYATLGMPSVAEAVNECNVPIIVCNYHAVSKIAKYCDSKCPSLHTIIYTTNLVKAEQQKTLPESGRFRCVSVAEVLGLGRGPGAFVAPAKESVAVIMYTSGSTGKPKGVLITHSNIVASAAGQCRTFEQFGLEPGGETYLAYLPTAHILELVFEMAVMALGSTVGYADPRTISPKGACRKRPDGTINCTPTYPYPPGGIQEFKPTIMCGVPKIWDILKKSVEEQVNKGSPMMQLLFREAYRARSEALANSRESYLFKQLVFSKIAGIMGGRLKLCVSGGGPIAAEVQEFITTVFCAPLVQGYALTETTCAGTIQWIKDRRTGVVGAPVPNNEIKLRSCLGPDGKPEVGDREQKPYLSTDRSHYGKPCLGRGEVLMRGPSISKGYLRQKELTDEVFDSDGWFHTGDIAVWMDDGALQIVDRLKNLVKLKGGEYVAIEAMEREYSTCSIVSAINGGIMCYADADMDRPVCLVQVNTRELTDWANSAGVAYNSVEELCNTPQAMEYVLGIFVKKAKSGESLGANEVLAGCGLIPGTGPPDVLTATSPWTSDNAALTASNKLNRKPLASGCDELLQKVKQMGIK